MNLMNWPTIRRTRRNCDRPKEGRSPRFACVNSRSSGQTRKFQQDCDGSRGAGGSSNSSTSQPFRHQPFTQQSFRPYRSTRTPQPSDKCFACGQFGHWANSPSVLATAAPTVTGSCQLPQPLPLPNKGTLERLGTDEYRNVVDTFSSFVGIEETDLLERSYVDYFEGSESVIVKGRLRANVQFWESIGTSHFVLSVIREGYKIPSYYTPTSVFLPNNKSALLNADFVLGAITELRKVGSVVQCPCPPVVLNPLSVSIQPTGKKRLILDLRHVNFFVKKSKIKFEDTKSFLECLVASPCAWACSFDIKSGYHHIEIFESDQQFLGFSWVFDGVTKYFQFTVLPFGLSVGPYFFFQSYETFS